MRVPWRKIQIDAILTEAIQGQIPQPFRGSDNTFQDLADFFFHGNPMLSRTNPEALVELYVDLSHAQASHFPMIARAVIDVRC